MDNVNLKDKSFQEIKVKILECSDEMGVTIKNILLFGSMVRGDFSDSSDYNLLIITEKTFTVKEKMGITKESENAWQNLLWM